MAAYLLDGRAIDAILALVFIEGCVLVVWRAQTGSGLPAATVIANLSSGACLLLALRAALVGASPAVILAWLATSLAAHGADLAARWRARPDPPGKQGVAGAKGADGRQPSRAADVRRRWPEAVALLAPLLGTRKHRSLGM
jgi:hypothetical protein